jgi:preprotein translocase subunit SecB
LAAAPAPPDLHIVQLIDVVLERLSTRSSGASPDADPAEGPTVEFPRVALRSSNDDRTEFECSARAKVAALVGGGRWTCEIVVRGVFASGRPLARRELAFFVRTSAVYVLWPYARVYADVAARLAGLALPPLPLIIRPPE